MKKGANKREYTIDDYSRIRGELYCKHGVGHSNTIHGCDGCCSKDDWKAAYSKFRNLHIKGKL